MTASAPRTDPISRLNNPARTYRSRRFAHALTDADAQLTAVVDRYSFNVGLFHSLLCDGLSRRTTTRGHSGSLILRCWTLSFLSPDRFIPALPYTLPRTLPVGMDAWGWSALGPWLPTAWSFLSGALFCV